MHDSMIYFLSALCFATGTFIGLIYHPARKTVTNKPMSEVVEPSAPKVMRLYIITLKSMDVHKVLGDEWGSSMLHGVAHLTIYQHGGAVAMFPMGEWISAVVHNAPASPEPAE